MEPVVAPDHSGYLQLALDGLGTAAETYYVELYGSMVYYWRSKSQSMSDAPAGSVSLVGTRVAESALSRLAWTVQGDHLSRPHLFLATDAQDKARWVEQMTHYDPTTTVHLATAAGPDAEEERTVYTSRRGKVSLRDFEVTAVIGRGSFGCVYQVVKKGTGEVFAMKEMSKEVVEHENLTENIFAEKSILQNIRHPFIVTLHYAFQTKDRLYLVLDLLSGGELFFHLSEVGVFSEYRAKFYTAEIALAIGHLHSLNIIYRDLKPENVVLDGEGHVCLTDFGLAKANVFDASASTFCGTPEYLAPEFLLGSPHGKAVDWWSLGTLFYEMLFGIPPFYSENVNAMYEAIISAPLEFKSEVAVSDDAKDLLRRLLDRDPATRMQSIDAMRAHPLFHDMDFDLLYQRKLSAPFRPDANTLNNFDKEFTTQAPVVASGDEFAQGHANVAGFTYDSTNPYNTRLFAPDSPSPTAVLATTTTGGGRGSAPRNGGTRDGDARADSPTAATNADACGAAAATARPPLLQPTRVLAHRERRASRLLCGEFDSVSPSEQQTSSCASPVEGRTGEALNAFSRPGSGYDVYTRIPSGSGAFTRRTQASSPSPKEAMAAASPARSDATGSQHLSPTERPFSSRLRSCKGLAAQRKTSLHFGPAPDSQA